MYHNALRLPAARLWPIAGCERAARRIRDMATPTRKRRHSVKEMLRECKLTENTLDFISTSLVGRRNCQLMDVNCTCVGADPKCRTVILSCDVTFVQSSSASFNFKARDNK